MGGGAEARDGGQALGRPGQGLPRPVGEAGPGGRAARPASLSPRRKAELGERLRAACGLSLTRALTLPRVSKSTYERRRARLSRHAPDTAAPGAAVRASFEASGGRYGYRRVRADALASGALAAAPERAVRASMARQGLEARDSRRAKRWSSYQGEVSDAPANLLMVEKGHDFKAGRPNVKWVTDITEMKAGPRKLYLSVIIGLYDGMPVAWRCSESPDAALANPAPGAAVATLREGERPLARPDRGARCRWPGWIGACERAGLTRPVSRKAHSPDNAACEAFFGRMKAGMCRWRDWSASSPEEFAAEAGRYMVWRAGGRLKSFKPEGCKTRCPYGTVRGRRERLGLASQGVQDSCRTPLRVSSGQRGPLSSLS